MIIEEDMTSAQFETNLIKAARFANALSQELKSIISTGDPLLAEFMLRLLQDSILIEQQLQRACAKIKNNSLSYSNRAASVETTYRRKGIVKVEAVQPGKPLTHMTIKAKSLAQGNPKERSYHAIKIH